MSLLIRTMLVSMMLLAIVAPVIAAEEVPTVLASLAGDSAPVPPPLNIDKALDFRYADFESFAKSKIEQLNRNHRFSRSRMEIVKRADGTYRARYHHIDDASLSIKVSRSRSKSIPFVGVLSYREQVFESSAMSPDQFDQSLFALVQVVPNRHIFSYQKGTWN